MQPGEGAGEEEGGGAEAVGEIPLLRLLRKHLLLRSRQQNLQPVSSQKANT